MSGYAGMADIPAFTAKMKLVAELMEYIRTHYRYEEDLAIKDGDQVRENQIVDMNFEDLLMELEEFIKNKRNRVTFLQLLEEYKREKNMTDSEIYKRAWIDRRHFLR
jgi:hypothetical protein